MKTKINYIENNDFDCNSNLMKLKIENTVYKVFMNYSYFSEKSKCFLISFKNLVKLMKEYNLLSDNLLSQIDLDIIIRKSTGVKFNFTFKDFLNILLNTSIKLSSDSKSATKYKTSFYNLVSKYLDNSLNIFKTDNNISTLKFKLENNNLQIRENNFYSKNNVYEHRNYNNISNSTSKNNSQNSFLVNNKKMYLKTDKLNTPFNKCKSQQIKKAIYFEGENLTFLSSNINKKRFLNKTCYLSRTTSKNKFKVYDFNTYLTKDFEKFIDNFEITDNHKKILNYNYSCLLDLYSYYFVYENNCFMNVETLRKENFISLTRFFKEFELLPYYFNTMAIKKYYIAFNNYDHENLLNKTLNLGNFFSVSNFMLLLCHISVFLYYKKYSFLFNNKINNILNNDDLCSEYNCQTKNLNDFLYTYHNDSDVLLLFFQHLLNSKGFKSFKITNTHSKTYNLIPDIETLKDLNSKAMFPKYNLIKSLSSYNFNSGRYLNLIKEDKINYLMTTLPSKKINIDTNNNTLNKHTSFDYNNNNILEFSKNVCLNNINQFNIDKVKLNSNLIRNDILIKYNMDSSNFKLKDLLEIKESSTDIIELYYIKGLKHIYNNYTNIGDKLNFDYLTLSSWIKLIEDSNIYKKTNELGLYVNKNLIYKEGLINYYNEDKFSFKDNNINHKINECDLNLIYTTLTGNKNFKNIFNSKDMGINKTTIKENVNININNNASYKQNFIEGSRTFLNKLSNSSNVNNNIKQDFKRNKFKNSNVIKGIINKMDFKLFVKSLELIAETIYPNQDINDSIFVVLKDVRLNIILINTI